MILARQHRNRSVFAMSVRWGPLLAEHRNVTRLYELVLQALREHARLAPAPNFLSARILHEEIVRLSIAEAKLHHLLRVVVHVEIELDTRSRVDGELRSQQCLRSIRRCR